MAARGWYVAKLAANWRRFQNRRDYSMSSVSLRGLGRLPVAAFAALAGALIFLGACASGSSENTAENAAFKEAPVEQLYNQALALVRRKDWENAAKSFDEVERQHPYSVWARRAILMSAYCYYEASKYNQAILAADRFIQLHPGNKDAPYAYYLKAVSLYEQIVDVGRDQRKTEQAMAALTELIRRFPQTEYARDARLKFDLTKDHLAGKEMTIGRYYLERGQYVSAINRFRIVIEKFQTTSHVPEALHRLVECYLSLGIAKEAQTAAAVLGYNYPGNEWYEDSFSLLAENKLQPADDKGSWISRAWGSVF
jgi:outer membrane protein assembly factor BamD